MEHALAEGSRNSDKNKAAVSILLNNTANKLFFRSTDRALQEYMNDLCPSVPGLGRVTSVRPPSTLQPGECYASLTDGRFERRQLLPFQVDRDSRGDSGKRDNVRLLRAATSVQSTNSILDRIRYALVIDGTNIELFRRFYLFNV